jgi:hypothetical protein
LPFLYHWEPSSNYFFQGRGGACQQKSLMVNRSAIFLRNFFSIFVFQGSVRQQKGLKMSCRWSMPVTKSFFLIFNSC